MLPVQPIDRNTAVPQGIGDPTTAPTSEAVAREREAATTALASLADTNAATERMGLRYVLRHMMKDKRAMTVSNVDSLWQLLAQCHPRRNNEMLFTLIKNSPTSAVSLQLLHLFCRKEHPYDVDSLDVNVLIPGITSIINFAPFSHSLYSAIFKLWEKTQHPGLRLLILELSFRQYHMRDPHFSNLFMAGLRTGKFLPGKTELDSTWIWLQLGFTKMTYAEFVQWRTCFTLPREVHQIPVDLCKNGMFMDSLLTWHLLETNINLQDPDHLRLFRRCVSELGPQHPDIILLWLKRRIANNEGFTRQVLSKCSPAQISSLIPKWYWINHEVLWQRMVELGPEFQPFSSDNATLIDQIGQLISKINGGKLSEAERNILIRWIEASPPSLHVTLFRNLMKVTDFPQLFIHFKVDPTQKSEEFIYFLIRLGVYWPELRLTSCQWEMARGLFGQTSTGWEDALRFHHDPEGSQCPILPSQFNTIFERLFVQYRALSNPANQGIIKEQLDAVLTALNPLIGEEINFPLEFQIEENLTEGVICGENHIPAALLFLRIVAKIAEHEGEISLEFATAFNLFIQNISQTLTPQDLFESRILNEILNQLYCYVPNFFVKGKINLAPLAPLNEVSIEIRKKVP